MCGNVPSPNNHAIDATYNVTSHQNMFIVDAYFVNFLHIVD